MLLYIFLAIVLLIGLLAGYAAMQPDDFQVTRSATMAAPASKIFAHVNDFHAWQAWSPWAKLDPAMRQEYSGASSGQGAIYWWTGNRQVGEGRMTILESRSPDLIRIKLEFIKPFTANNEAQFTFSGQNGQTTVTWSMTGKKNLMFKIMGLLMSMDDMVGKDFDKGLAAMKGVVESAA